MSAHGHRTVPHTADLRIEAWAGTREECLAEAVRGLVESFADTAGAHPRRTIERLVSAEGDADLLAAVLDEVIYGMDVDGEVPVRVAVRPAGGGGVNLVLSLAEATAVEIIGAAPKAVSFHELRCAVDGAGLWSCGATVDV
ncbi:MAG: archease [Micromonosporaceae bacterium]